MTVSVAMISGTFAPLYPAPRKKAVPKRTASSTLKKSVHIAAEVGSGIEHGVVAAAHTVEHALSPDTYFKTKVPYGRIIVREAKKNKIKPELIAAVIKQESRFKPKARSHAGALGLMQLLPRTGRWMGARNLLNPEQNIVAGAKYLRYLHDRFDGNTTKIIAAYNAGEGNVRRYRGVPPFRETRNYVRNVLNYTRQFAQAARGEGGA